MNRPLFVLLALFLFHSNLQAQKVENKHTHRLYVKTDVLLPLLSLVSMENEIIAGASLEYKMKDKWSAHISGYFHQNKIRYTQRGFQVIPEGRYFFHPHQFAGVYFKYDQIDFSDYPPVFDTYYNQHLALGALYGYQKTFGRWMFEGRIGLGANKSAKITNVFGNGIFELSDYKITLDTILAVNIGWKIF